MKNSTMLFLTVLLLPATSLAADKSGNFGSSLPKDLKSCDNYLTALDDCLNGHCYKQNLYNAWLNGYISAYNAYVDDIYNIIGGRDSASLNYWLANYCKKNAQGSFDTAVENLMTELKPQRIREKP